MTTLTEKTDSITMGEIAERLKSIEDKLRTLECLSDRLAVVAPLTPKKQPKPKRICVECGEDVVYAKELCRTCYERMRRQNSINDKIAEQEEDKKYHRDKYKEIIATLAIGEFDKPPDFDETMDVCLSNLRERERDILIARNRDMKIYRQIAREYDLSVERIRQIEHRALRVLKQKYAQLMRLGLAKNNQITELIEQQQNELLQKCEQAKQRNEDAWQRCFGSMSIEELGLGTRAHNCLKRANCNTAEQIAELASNGGLLKVRNLGSRSYEEVLDALRKTGWNGIIITDPQ